MVLEKTLESPLDCKEIQPVHSKGDQPWCSLEGMMIKLKLQYFGHLMWRVDSLEKTLMLGRDWGQEEKRTENEMAGWHHRLNGREFEWTPGDGDGQGGLACCDSWGRRVRHNWATELNWKHQLNYPQHGIIPSRPVLASNVQKPLIWIVKYIKASPLWPSSHQCWPLQVIPSSPWWSSVHHRLVHQI